MNALQFFRLLAGVNARILRRHILAVREKSFLMVSVITLFVVGYWFAGYTVFFMGFHRLAERAGDCREYWWTGCCTCSLPSCFSC